MKLENQVCSKEWAEKLKKLGVKQDSMLYWCDKELQMKTALGYIGNGCEGSDGSPDWISDEDFEEYYEKKYSAFTVAELYKILSDLDPHWDFNNLLGIIPEQLADFLAEKIVEVKPC